MNEMETQHGDIGATMTCITKCFHMRIEVFNICKYKTQGPLKTFFLLHHHHSCKGLLRQNMHGSSPCWPNPFPPMLPIINYYLTIDLLVSCNFLFTTKQGCA
jgi:hypothetical protein